MTLNEYVLYSAHTWFFSCVGYQSRLPNSLRKTSEIFCGLLLGVTEAVVLLDVELRAWSWQLKDKECCIDSNGWFIAITVGTDYTSL